MYDTIIIGAGLSGLAAGIRLAYYEQRVCILERHYTIGGLNSFYRLRGRDYDVGLHAVTNYATKGAKKGPLVRLLRQLRLSWEDFSLAPQIGSAIAFPGRAAGLQQRHSPPRKRNRPRLSRPAATTSSGCSVKFSTTTISTRTFRAVGPAGAGQHHHRSAAGRNAALSR